MVSNIDLCRMGCGFVVSVLSLVELRIPSERLHRFTCRFFINLRAIAFHQRKSIFENHVFFFFFVGKGGNAYLILMIQGPGG